MVTIVCKFCGESYEAKRPTRKFCSESCGKRSRYRDNAPRMRAKAALRRHRDIELTRSRDRARYSREAEHRRSYARAQYWADPETACERNKRWRESNPDRVREYRRRYYLDNKPFFYEAARRREIAVSNATVVRFSAEQLAERLSMFPGCWICGDLADVMHIDHVKPLSKGGPHMLSNLRPACAPCNLSKAAQWPFVPINAGWQNAGT